MHISLREVRDSVQARPLHARAAADNTDSVRVLEKCGFTVTGTGRGYAQARGEETDELLLPGSIAPG